VLLRTRTASILAVGALVLTGCSGGSDEPSGSSGPGGTEAGSGEPDPPEIPGMAVLVSDADLADTVDRLEGAIGDIGTVTATVDHADAASGAGLDLDPTVLVVGSGADAAAPILQQAQSAGLDLPQKYLVWEDDGVVYLGYNTVEWIARQAGIGPRSDALDALRYGSEAIASAATGAEPAREAPDPGEPVEETTVPSDAGFDETLERLQAAVQDADMSSPATVDEAALARRAGTQLRATTVTLAGDPETGTPLIAQQPTMGLDLPLRFLVAEGADGTVSVSYPDLAGLAARHGVDDADAVAALAEGQERLVAAATGTG